MIDTNNKARAKNPRSTKGVLAAHGDLYPATTDLPDLLAVIRCCQPETAEQAKAIVRVRRDLATAIRSARSGGTELLRCMQRIRRRNLHLFMQAMIGQLGTRSAIRCACREFGMTPEQVSLELELYARQKAPKGGNS